MPEMRCPHSERITYCEDCMLLLNNPELLFKKIEEDEDEDDGNTIL